MGAVARLQVAGPQEAVAEEGEVAVADEGEDAVAPALIRRV